MKKCFLYYLPIYLMFFVGFLPQSFGETLDEFLAARHQQKKEVRWTLAGWLSTRKRMNLMDQWLLMNTDQEPSWLDIVLGGENMKYEIDRDNDGNDERYEGAKGYISFWAYRFGFEIQYEDSDEGIIERAIMGHLRILGNSNQTTHLNFFYGGRKYNFLDRGEFRQDFYGGNITIYIFDFIGLQGMFRTYPRFINEEGTTDIKGENYEYGGFLESGFIRIYAKYVVDKLLIHDATSRFEERRKGVILGINLFI